MNDSPVISENPDRINSADANLSRRHLLSGAAAAGLGAACGFWSERPAEGRSPAIQEKLKLGFVGVGNFGVNNIAALVDEEITGLCDVDEKFLAEMGLQFPKAKRFVDWRKMIEELSLDGVVVSTPDHTHAVVAMRAIQAGRHVYCEKPLAHSISEGRLLAAAADEKRVATQLGIQHHPTPGYWQAYQLITSGALGKISEVHCWTARPIWPQGELTRPTERPEIPRGLNWDLWLGPAPERPYHSAYLPIRWRGWWDFGTGSLGDMGPHLMDPVVHALRLSAPKTISAESGPVTAESPPAWCIVEWEFAARESRGPVKLCYYDGGRRPPMEVTGNDRLPPDGTLFIGSKARLFAPQRGATPYIFPRDPADKIPLPELPAKPPLSHHQTWVNACRSGRSASTPFSWGAALCEIPLLGNLAIRTGRKLAWDSEKMTTSDQEADALLRREYRRGWELTK